MGWWVSTWGSLPGVGGYGWSRDGAELRSVLSAAALWEGLVRKGDSQQCPCCCPDPPLGPPAQLYQLLRGLKSSSFVTKVVGDGVDSFTLHCCFKNELQNQSGQWLFLVPHPGERFWFNGLLKAQGIKGFPRDETSSRVVAVILKAHGLYTGICILLAPSHLQRPLKATKFCPWGCRFFFFPTEVFRCFSAACSWNLPSISLQVIFTGLALNWAGSGVS